MGNYNQKSWNQRILNEMCEKLVWFQLYKTQQTTRKKMNKFFQKVVGGTAQNIKEMQQGINKDFFW